MELYSECANYKLYNGDMNDMLQVISPNSIDSIVTDPPYELNFMGKGWDNSGVSFNKSTWELCFNVLKPGGYLLAFGGSRTFHRIACAIEDAGFEIRDTIMWVYGSGFPKSMNIGLALDKKNGVDNRTGNIKHDGGQGGGVGTFSDDNYEWKKCYEERIATNQWKGWGTCLKPSYEPIIVARKPFNGSLLDNIESYGVGGLNIDECRVPLSYNEHGSDVDTDDVENGRFPANFILTYDDSDYDEVCGGFPNSGSGNNSGVYSYAGVEYNNKDTSMFNGDKPKAPSNYNDNGSASRYFYCAKASKKDRDEGLECFDVKYAGELQGGRKEGSAGSLRVRKDGSIGVNPYAGNGSPKRNMHPTVKPTELMQYLVRLVTPNGGTILDPFNGSGSTGKAVMYENKERNKNYKYIGIELTKDYLPIAKSRIDYAIKDTNDYSYDDKKNICVTRSADGNFVKYNIFED